MKLAVVKLGGSTLADAALFGWVGALAEARMPLVIVPGGGPFANQVRDAQASVGFSDAAAHAMAILAMDQFGLMLCDVNKRFVPARSRDDMVEAIARGHIPVWLPSVMTRGRGDIPQSWDVTSDSLAAWLAGQLQADALLLIKQTRNIRVEDDAVSLSQRGIVDPCFPSMLPSGVAFYVSGPGDLAGAAEVLTRGELPGIRIGQAEVAA
jgi:aspartokinase-like uncharacterized kinase